MPVIAAYVSRHSTPDQRVAIWGSEPELYFYTRRHAASGHIYLYSVLERQPFATLLQKELCREIETAKPEFFVLVHMPKSLWIATSAVDQSTVTWLDSYLSSYYRPVGLVDIVSPRRTDYRWDDEATQAQPRRFQLHLGLPAKQLTGSRISRGCLSHFFNGLPTGPRCLGRQLSDAMPAVCGGDTSAKSPLFWRGETSGPMIVGKRESWQT